jgi:hypothetical protein
MRAGPKGVRSGAAAPLHRRRSRRPVWPSPQPSAGERLASDGPRRRLQCFLGNRMRWLELRSSQRAEGWSPFSQPTQLANTRPSPPTPPPTLPGRPSPHPSHAAALPTRRRPPGAIRARHPGAAVKPVVAQTRRGLSTNLACQHAPLSTYPSPRASKLSPEPRCLLPTPWAGGATPACGHPADTPRAHHVLLGFKCIASVPNPSVVLLA